MTALQSAQAWPLLSSPRSAAVGLSFAGLGAWLAGKGQVVLPLMIASFGLIAWIFHRRYAKADRCVTTIHKEGEKP